MGRTQPGSSEYTSGALLSKHHPSTCQAHLYHVSITNGKGP